MFPPIFPAVNIPAVQALLKTGSGPLRFYMFGEAPQNTPLPYAVWQTRSGAPENYLNATPDTDQMGLQIDVYSSPEQGPSRARLAAVALRDAIEPVAYVVAWRGESVDPDTRNFRVSFDVDWWVAR